MARRKKEIPKISVWYYARDGRLYFVSENEEDKDGIKYRYEKCVPDDILSKGDEDIKQYVASEITKKRRAVQKIINKRQKKIRGTNFSLMVVHEGVCLEGRITRYDPQEGFVGFLISLEKPEAYKNEYRSVERKWVGPFFDENGDLFKRNIESAERDLVRMYETKKQEIKESEIKKIAPLAYKAAERLNKKERKENGNK